MRDAEAPRSVRSTIPVSVLALLVVVAGVVTIVARHEPPGEMGLSTPAFSSGLPEVAPEAGPVLRRFERGTLESMATSGARSLALNMAAGNTEVVQALMGGPISVAASSHCSARVVSTLLFPSPHGRLARAEHAADVQENARSLHPRAIGSASARVPEGITAPRGSIGGQRRDAHGVRVSVLLYDCGSS